MGNEAEQSSFRIRPTALEEEILSLLVPRVLFVVSFAGNFGVLLRVQLGEFVARMNLLVLGFLTLGELDIYAGRRIILHVVVPLASLVTPRRAVARLRLVEKTTSIAPPATSGLVSGARHVTSVFQKSEGVFSFQSLFSGM